MMILRTESFMVISICGVLLNDKIGVKYLTGMFVFSNAMHELAMTSSVRLYGHVLRMEDGHIL